MFAAVFQQSSDKFRHRQRPPSHRIVKFESAVRLKTIGGGCWMKRYWLALLLIAVARPALARSADVEFFEQKIRPVLVQRCYSCHSSKLAAPKGDLTLDSKAGLLKGGH